VCRPPSSGTSRSLMNLSTWNLSSFPPNWPKKHLQSGQKLPQLPQIDAARVAHVLLAQDDAPLHGGEDHVALGAVEGLDQGEQQALEALGHFRQDWLDVGGGIGTFSRTCR
jgi:hypothetical protein